MYPCHSNTDRASSLLTFLEYTAKINKLVNFYAESTLDYLLTVKTHGDSNRHASIVYWLCSLPKSYYVLWTGFLAAMYHRKSVQGSRTTNNNTVDI